MDRELVVARTLLAVLAATFLLSAVLLAKVHARRWQVWAWAGAGVLGLVLSPLLGPTRPAVSLLASAVLGGLLLWALRGDARNRSGLMVTVDVSGLVALAAALVLAAG